MLQNVNNKSNILLKDRLEIYYNPKFCPKGKTLAKSIDNNLDKKHFDNKHYADVYTANHCVTRAKGNNIPSVLVEMGFITNASFRAATNKQPVRTELVNAISQSVAKYNF